MKFRYDVKNEELVVSESSRIEYHQLNLWLTRHVSGYRYMPAYKIGAWNGQYSYFRNGKINLGLWRECYNSCKEIETPFIIENKEDFPINREVTLDGVREFCHNFFKNHKVKNSKGEFVPFMPYDHQIETAYKILKNRYCMAEVATSGGKSLIISIVIFYTLSKIKGDAKFLIVVPSITLVTQFYDDITEYNMGVNNLQDSRESFLSRVLDDVDNKSMALGIRIEEVMSDRPRKYSGTQNPNIYIGTYQSLDKWPKKFFRQFHTVACDEAHGVKSKTLSTILHRTFGSAYSRFGVSGTFPPEDSYEILSIQSVLGPKISEVSANQLKNKGIITPMDIKVVIANHNDLDFDEKIYQIKKGGFGKEALLLEKDYIHISDKRLDLVKKILSKCDKNTLILFHSIEYGQRIFEKLRSECGDKEFYYIDGEVKNKKREEIKKEMEILPKDVEYSILDFGDFQIDVKSDFKIKLINGDWKNADEITPDDDIDDDFLKTIR
jgi:superfamily II DNA or RNA helicase